MRYIHETLRLLTFSPGICEHSYSSDTDTVEDYLHLHIDPVLIFLPNIRKPLFLGKTIHLPRTAEQVGREVILYPRITAAPILDTTDIAFHVLNKLYRPTASQKSSFAIAQEFAEGLDTRPGNYHGYPLNDHWWFRMWKEKSEGSEKIFSALSSRWTPDLDKDN
jgi:hypothetical protein